MASNFNKIIVDGRLGADPEMRYTQSGTAVTTLRLANSQYDAQAESKELTTWYRVSIFGKRAEAANQYLAKGARVLISGSHRIREYTDKDGNVKQSNEIVADDFAFLDSKSSQGEYQAIAEQRQHSNPQTTKRNIPAAIEEDLPF